ncbi:hypothetical protein ACFYT4_13465 [Streptomyces sp. NPDC004609]|uniref:hypothetical protein n=1 Tax=Streptomyces sp. NPDC004609 TaxID=3364704 RepID=UPI00368A40EF
MSGLAVALALGPVALVMAPAATTAYAHDSVTATVEPAEASVGQEVVIRVRGCKDTTGAAKTKAFAAGAQLFPDREGNRSAGQDSQLVARGRVSSGAVSGPQIVKVICDGHGHVTKTSIKVVGGRSSHGGGGTPYAPVRAGGGGTAALATGHEVGEGTGPGTRHAVIGLVLAGTAAVAVAVRSTRRRRRPDADGHVHH